MCLSTYFNVLTCYSLWLRKCGVYIMLNAHILNTATVALNGNL